MLTIIQHNFSSIQNGLCFRQNKMTVLVLESSWEQKKFEKVITVYKSSTNITENITTGISTINNT